MIRAARAFLRVKTPGHAADHRRTTYGLEFPVAIEEIT
jgi:hypothetical protein